MGCIRVLVIELALNLVEKLQEILRLLLLDGLVMQDVMA